MCLYTGYVEHWHIKVVDDESDEEREKVLVVSLSHAIPNPYAVVIKVLHAVVAVTAMGRPWWPPGPACLTILCLSHLVSAVVINRFVERSNASYESFKHE